jgi:hypothetical protein
MPRATAQGCLFGPERTDLARHDFAGASAWVLQIIGLYFRNDWHLDPWAILRGYQKAVDMLQRAASLELQQECGSLRVRVINETGHKLPTGHIEGRRVWVNVRFYDGRDRMISEYGRYDPVSADLDEETTAVYEMHVGLSEEAARITGLPAGVTTHMALADTIVKDNRIPPRGFANQAFAAAGAPVVGAAYADGQYWADSFYILPQKAERAIATVYYQTVTRHYIEALRDGNHTDHWGQTLYDLWLATDMAPPIAMASAELLLNPYLYGDADSDADLDLADLARLSPCMAGPSTPASANCHCMDFDGNARIDLRDVSEFQTFFTSP